MKKEKEKKYNMVVPMVIRGRGFEGKIKKKDAIIFLIKYGLKNYNANKSV